MKRVLLAAALALAPAACGGAAEKKAVADPADKPAPPPLPHADRKDDPTVIVPGDPPLTQGTLDRDLDFWEWALDLNLTDRQRAQWQKGWADAVAKLKGDAKAQRLSAVRGNVQLWDGVGKLGRLERDVLRFQTQPGALAYLRSSTESEHKFLVGLYEEGHKPGGARNPVLVKGDPPLTQDMVDLLRMGLDYVLDFQMTDRQRDEFQRVFSEVWKKHDAKEWAKNIESWRQPLSMRAYARRVWRAGVRPNVLDFLRKEDSECSRWVLVECHYWIDG